MSSGEETAYRWLAERAEMSPSGDSGNGTEFANGTRPDNRTEPAAAYGAEAPVVADSTPSMNDSGREPAVPFLQSLVDAMRKIADQTRDDALGKLRASVAERAAAIRAETEQRAAELHEVANADLASVAGWEQAEIQRIRDEAGTKVSARNATLDAQLAANLAAGEGAMTAAEARVDAFEAEMTSFFAQLDDIHDPAALGSALKRIPQAPSLDAVPAPAGDTAPAPAAVAAAEAEVPAVPVITPEPEPAPAAASVVAGTAAPDVPEAAPAEAASAPAITVASAPEAASEVTPVAQVVADAPAEQVVVADAPAEPAGAEATTQVLVTGLTSFGAITTFKQSLEHVAGIHRVSLGLGTSGEFIFTAIHRDGFDLAGAIRTFEESAQFVASNGQLRVTVSSKA